MGQGCPAGWLGCPNLLCAIEVWTRLVVWISFDRNVMILNITILSKGRASVKFGTPSKVSLLFFLYGFPGVFMLSQKCCINKKIIFTPYTLNRAHKEMAPVFKYFLLICPLRSGSNPCKYWNTTYNRKGELQIHYKLYCSIFKPNLYCLTIALTNG